MSGDGGAVGRKLRGTALALALALAGGFAGAGCHDRAPAASADAAADAGRDAMVAGEAEAGVDAPAGDADGALPRALFNGVDFTGWDRYLGKPSSAEPPLGVDNDPRGVYSVVTLDNEPAIRISGEVWGALTSRETLCDFHLRLEYRWGTAVWPPLNAQDSGIMYLSTGPFGAVNAGGPTLSSPAGSGGFMVSEEYQITPADVGGMYSLGPIDFQTAPRNQLGDNPGQWNQIDIIVSGGTARHQLNGQDVTSGSGFVLQLPGAAEEALSCGKLQLQCEGAEIFFRRVQLLPLP